MVSAFFTGDCRRLLRELPPACAQTCVTSPPYFGLRDYDVDGQIGLEPTPKAYVAELVGVFELVRRVLKDDGTLWLNLGDSYSHGGCGGRDANRWPKQSRNNHVPPRKYRKNVAPVHAKKKTGLKPKDLIGIPWEVAFALRTAGWWLRSEIIWHKPNPMPESVADRPTKSHETIFLLAKSESYYYDAKAIREQSVTEDARRPYMSPGAKKVDGREEWRGGEGRDGDDFTKRNKRDVWTVTAQPYADAHFATFPPKLIEPCILAGSRPGDLVIDPFFGSGTTGEVAEKYGRRWIGFDLNPAYAKLQAERTAQRSLVLP